MAKERDSLRHARKRDGRPTSGRARSGHRQARGARARSLADSARRNQSDHDRQFRVFQRRIAPSHLHEQQARLARQFPRRLLGARSVQRAAQEARRRRPPVDLDVRHVLAGRQAASATSTRTISTFKSLLDLRIIAAHQATARTPSSTARSIGSTKKSSACATAFAGAPTASRSPIGSSTAKASRSFSSPTAPTGPMPASYRSAIRRRARRTPRRASASSAPSGGKTLWLEIPGDPREHYLAKMEWAGDDIALQQFNRLQNVNRVMLAESAGPAAVRRSSRRKTPPGWKTTTNFAGSTTASRSSGSASATAGSTPISCRATAEVDPADHERRVRRHSNRSRSMRKAAGSISSLRRAIRRSAISIASPLKGGAAERVTPDDQPGTHAYAISPDAQWAVHSYSRFGTPPVADLVQICRTTMSSRRLPTMRPEETLAAVRMGKADLFRIDIGNETLARRLVHQAAGLRPGQEISGALLRLRRAGRPDGARSLGRQAIPMAFHARPAGIHRDERRQSRHAGAARPRLAAAASTAKSASSPPPTRRPPCALCSRSGPIWTPHASRSGAGAAAAR